MPQRQTRRAPPSSRQIKLRPARHRLRRQRRPEALALVPRAVVRRPHQQLGALRPQGECLVDVAFPVRNHRQVAGAGADRGSLIGAFQPAKLFFSSIGLPVRGSRTWMWTVGAFVAMLQALHAGALPAARATSGMPSGARRG